MTSIPPNPLTPTKQRIPWEILTDLQRKVLADRLNNHSYRSIALYMKLDESTIRGHEKRAWARIDKHRQETT